MLLHLWLRLGLPMDGAAAKVHAGSASLRTTTESGAYSPLAVVREFGHGTSPRLDRPLEFPCCQPD